MTKVCIVGLQWGDEGKGKIVDVLADKADCVARFQGGSNAGHTIVTNGTKYKLSLIPSGILRDNLVAYIGSGVALDLPTLIDEISHLKPAIPEIENRLKLSHLSSIVLDIHKKLDLASERARGEEKIGTTLKGIGSAYQDTVSRIGLRLCDLRDADYLKSRLEFMYDFYSPILARYSIEPESLTSCVESLAKQWERVKDMVSYDPFFIKSSNFENILFEGAQGVLLDRCYGTYPYVTSSSTITSAIFHGAMPGSFNLDKVFGILKAYSTRVGEGPFPTEDCGKIGAYLQREGRELGTVTGRARRCGFLDLVLARYASKLCGVTDLILTKLDVLSGLDKIGVCTQYKIGDKTLDTMPYHSKIQEEIEPIFEYLPGWDSDISKARNFPYLPHEVTTYIEYIESYIGAKIAVVSNGPDRENVIFRSSIWI